MSINYSQKVNERVIGLSITNESHTVGIVGVGTAEPGFILLVEVPQAPSPLSTVSITGSGGPYNEITSGTPTGGQFLVDYTTGAITFAVAQDGNVVLVSYIGLGSEFAAEDINELQGPVGVALNFDGSLSSHSVKPLSISTTTTDDFTFPRDVFVTRNLVPLSVTSTSSSTAMSGVVRLANAVDFISWRNVGNTADLALTVNASNQLTFNGVPIEISSLTSAHIFVGNGSNVATDTALSGDASLSNTGVLSLSTVNSNVGSFGSSTSIPSFTVNGKGLITAAGTNVVVAPAGTLTGTTLASNVVTSSLTTVGTIGTGIWQGTPVTVSFGGTGQTSFPNGPTGSEILFGNGTSPIGSTSNLTWDTVNNQLRTLDGSVSFAAYAFVNASDTGLFYVNNAGADELHMTSGGTDFLHFDPTGLRLISSFTIVAPSLGINLATTQDASAVVEIDSTTQGFLPPRMTTIQRTSIASPAKGLMVYDTDLDQFFGYSGSWIILG